MSKKYEILTTPFKIGNVTIRNRFAVAPMSLGFYLDEKQGYNILGIDHYTEQAKGGFGLIFTGAFNCDGQVDPYNPFGQNWVAGKEDHVRRTAVEMINRCHKYGTKVWGHVTLGVGHNVPGGFHGCSELPVYGAPGEVCPALTKEQIKMKVDQMVATAVSMKEAGFDGFDVHAIHDGYLLDEFAMEALNHRTDEYGGSLENRLRIHKEIVEGIKAACGKEWPVTIRLGLKSYVREFADGSEGNLRGHGSTTGEGEIGRDVAECIEIAKMLESFGYDALSCDVGAYESNYMGFPTNYTKRGFNIDIAGEVRKHINIPIILAGRNTDPDLAEAGIKAGKFDCVALGRQSLADPAFPKKVEMGLPEKIRPCIACNAACIGDLHAGGYVSCTVNPEIGHDKQWRMQKAMEPKNVLIVGGGVAGMEAARVATKRGHKVAIYEKSGELGGALIPAGVHEFKEVIRLLNDWYKQEMEALNIEIHLNAEMTTEKIKELNPDVVIFAIGAKEKKFVVPGCELPNAATAMEILSGKKQLGDKVIVVGGGQTGCEIALDCINQGKEVSIVVASSGILSRGVAMPPHNANYLFDKFWEEKTPIFTNCQLKEITPEGAVIVQEGQEQLLEADTVVIAKGFESLPSVASELYGTGIEVYEIGDGQRVGNIQTCIWGAYDVAKQI